MPETGYRLDPKSLKDLCTEAGDGRVQLPDFQRGWVWDDSHIRSLLASISLSYPVGAVMMLEAGGGSTQFKQRPLEGTPASTEEAKADRLILDGQQRLTALFQSLLSGKPVGQRKRWYYVDMKMALDEKSDREEAVFSIPENRIEKGRNKIPKDYSKTEYEYENMVFPLKDVFNSDEWETGFFEHWNYDKERIKFWQSFKNAVIKKFEGYQVPVIELGKETPKEAICQVFEKVNTGGVKLTVFELLTAMFAADGFALREHWEARQKQLEEHSVLAKVSGTDFLQAVTLLATRERRERERQNGTPRPPAISCKRADMLSLTLREYERWADSLVKGFNQAAFFLYDQSVRNAKFLPYSSQLIPLAAILTVLDKDPLTDGEKDKLAQWYWCGVFGELYRSTIETRFARDLPDVVDWVRGGESMPRTVEEAWEQFRPNRLLSLQDLRQAASKGVYSLILREKARDWSTGYEMEHFNAFDYAVDIHHIFPQKWCSTKKFDMVLCNSIVNRTPLYAPTNRKIGAKAPSKYTSDIGSDKMKLDEYLRTHFIEPDLLRSDDFHEFFKERHKKLVDQIGKAMGKDAVWDDDEGEEPPDDDEVIDEDE